MGIYSIPFSFVTGKAFSIAFQMTSLGGGNQYAQEEQVAGYYLADQFNSFYFAGVSDVVINGIRTDEFTIIGANGMDYRTSYLPQTINAVPEPRAMGFIVGMLMLLFVLKRQIGRFERRGNLRLGGAQS